MHPWEIFLNMEAEQDKEDRKTYHQFPSIHGFFTQDALVHWSVLLMRLIETQCYLHTTYKNHKLLENRQVQKINICVSQYNKSQHFHNAACIHSLLLLNQFLPTEWHKTAEMCQFIIFFIVWCSMASQAAQGVPSILIWGPWCSRCSPKLIFIVEDVCSLWSQD